jgi:hypothetical protein
VRVSLKLHTTPQTQRASHAPGPLENTPFAAPATLAMPSYTKSLMKQNAFHVCDNFFENMCARSPDIRALSCARASHTHHCAISCFARMCVDTARSDSETVSWLNLLTTAAGTIHISADMDCPCSRG